MFCLRLATDDDKDFIFDAFKRAMREYVEWAWGWDEEAQRYSFWRNFPIKGEGDGLKVICVADQRAGALFVEEAAQYYWVRTIFLLPEFQGMSIGSALLEQEAVRARSVGKHFALKVIKMNPAKRLYERLGFKVVSEDDVTYSMQMALP